ncbi:MAG: fused MFS/spermidine synthase [Bacteroidota bacterium]
MNPLQNPIALDRRLMLAVVALGATSIVTQVILLRDFLSAFYGNELVIGIILANWMIITAAGSFLGKYSSKLISNDNFVSLLLASVAVLPGVTLFLLRLLRNIVFIPGSMVGITQILYTSFILLLPFCLVSGFSFTLLAQRVSAKYGSNLIGRIYALEALGSVVGGLIFNLVLIFYLQTFQSLILLMAIDFLAALLLLIKEKKRAVVASAAFGVIALVVLIFTSDLDDLTRRIQFQGQELLFHKDTPYGNLVITKQADQMNFYENNMLLFSTNDVVANEEAVHYAMIQHANPRSVLLISGGISGTMQEILKYNVDRIDYVEINPWIIDIGKRYTSALADKRVHIINQDARMYVKRASQKYDVVLINLPDPSTAQLNRYYTIAFFEELQRLLNKNAVLSMSLISSADYLSSESRQVRSVIVNTLNTVFKNILIVPGSRDYILASDGSMDIHVARLIRERGIPTIYVNENYLDDELQKQRSEFILGTLDRHSPINEDFTPISYHRQLLYWLSQFQNNYWILAAGGLLVVIFLAGRMNTITFGVLTGGFAASSVEILLLISLQIIYGYIYFLAGVIISIFMAGLALGAMAGYKVPRRSNIDRFISVQLYIGIFALIAPAGLTFLNSHSTNFYLVHSIFFTSTFAFALCIGAEFTLASRLQKGNISTIASNLYSVDLVGSAIGALLVTAYLIPLLGIMKVCCIVAGLMFSSTAVSILNRKKYLTVV